MSWSYNPTILATSELMQLRLAIGDTDSQEPLLQDEEIVYAAQVEGHYSIASAARCCELIARKFARLTTNALGPSKVEAQQKYEHYRNEAYRLRKQANAMHAPSAGGIYPADDVPSPDVAPGIFSIGMMSDRATEA